MKGYALVVLGCLSLFGRIEARPQDDTATPSEQVTKSDEAGEKKDDLIKTGEGSTTTAVEGKSGEKIAEPDPADPKVKRATDESLTQEKNEKSSIEGSTTAAAGEGRGHNEKDSNPIESTESSKIGVEEKHASINSSTENKSDDNINNRSDVAERIVAAESRENKDSAKEEPRSSGDVSTSTEVVQLKSAYGSASILETKGRSGQSRESDSSDFKGRAHMNFRMPHVNPLGVINNINDIGSRRMAQPNLMHNVPHNFPPPSNQILPKIPPPSFNSYLNAAPSMPNLPNVPNLSQNRRSYNEYRPETNAYPYTPTSSQQADSLPKLPSLRDVPKFGGYNSFYKPYDLNYSGNYGSRPRRYTASTPPDAMNRYAFNNFGYPQYIK